MCVAIDLDYNKKHISLGQQSTNDDASGVDLMLSKLETLLIFRLPATSAKYYTQPREEEAIFLL